MCVCVCMLVYVYTYMCIHVYVYIEWAVYVHVHVDRHTCAWRYTVVLYIILGDRISHYPGVHQLA